MKVWLKIEAYNEFSWFYLYVWDNKISDCLEFCPCRLSHSSKTCILWPRTRSAFYSHPQPPQTLYKHSHPFQVTGPTPLFERQPPPSCCLTQYCWCRRLRVGHCSWKFVFEDVGIFNRWRNTNNIHMHAARCNFYFNMLC